MARDYYEVLGVPRNAPEKDIRAAYRRLARQHHPDVNPGNKQAEARFKELNEAYQTLSSADSRAKYDRFGEHWRRYDAASPAGASAGGGAPFTWSAQQAGRRRGRRAPFVDAAAEDTGGDIGDMFANLFGGRRGATYEDTRLETVETPVGVTLEEAYAGTRRVVEAQAGSFNGARRLEVRIPPGVDTGARVHIAAPAAGGAVLDVNLVITVAPHETFERKGDDLLVAVPVPLVDAMLGGEVEVPTIRGTRVALKLPAETQNGRTFRLKGQGMPRRKPADGATHGDLLATVKVTLPARLTREERALFERLREGRQAERL